MIDYRQMVQTIIDRFDEKQIKKLHLEVLLNLLNKVNDIDDSELEDKISRVVRILGDLESSGTLKSKEYQKSFAELTKHIRTKYGYVAKGDIQSESVALGIGIGVVFGTLLISINAGFMAIGIAVGAGIGTAIGTRKEKAEYEKGNIY